jgi:tetratricopeptide (TPR) repeat protein
MKKSILVAALVALVCGVFADAAQAPTAKQPQPKSQAEVEAIQAMFNAQDPDARIAAAENLITKYADTEFKSVGLLVAAMSYQQKNDIEKMMVYAERTLEADANNYTAMLMLASATAQRTREFDLDREEKLGQAEKHAKTAIDLIAKAAKPNPSVTDEQWEAAKKDMIAQAHEALGLAQLARKKYEPAIAEFKLAVEGAATPEPATYLRIGDALHQLGKYDEAIVEFDKVMANANTTAQVKQFAQALRVRSVQARDKGKTPSPATPAGAQPGGGVQAAPAAPAEVKKP